MRWRLIRRRLSISAPRMTVRSHLPWPLRWAVVAIALGFSASLALWAFEFGKGIAGLDHESRQAVKLLAESRKQISQLEQERNSAQSLANAADSIIKAERATQQRLGEQVKTLEMENQTLKDDLGFFERLLPATGDGLAIRGFQVNIVSPGQLQFQLLIMQQGGRIQTEFKGRYELLVSGTQNGKAWSIPTPLASKTLQVRQYQRVDGVVAFPDNVVLKHVQAQVIDEKGRLKASQSIKL